MHAPSLSSSNRLRFSHDSKQSRDLYRSLCAMILNVADLSADDWEVVLMAASGTQAMETVISSLAISRDCVLTTGAFSDRARRLALDVDADGPTYACRYETNDALQPDRWNEADVLDCVSAWPYYNDFGSARCWFTVSGKQLRAGPGVGIAVLHRDVVEEVMDTRSEYSTLSLRAHLEAAERQRTLTTVDVGCMLRLAANLSAAELDGGAAIRVRCDAARKRVASLLPSGMRFDGEGPVLNVPRGQSSDFDAAMETVDCWRTPTAWQFFLYNASPQDELWNVLQSLR